MWPRIGGSPEAGKPIGLELNFNVGKKKNVFNYVVIRIHVPNTFSFMNCPAKEKTVLFLNIMVKP